MTTSAVTNGGSRRRDSGFTLVEVLVTIVLVSVAIVGTMGALRSIQRGNASANTADLLQNLAQQKLNDLSTSATPAGNGSAGNFSDRGYPNITWSLEDNATSVTNLNLDTVTVTSGKDSESISTEIDVVPQTTSSTAAP